MPDQQGRRDPEREFLMATMISGGMTLEQVGQHFGVTRERVRQILMRNGIVSPGGQRTDPIAVLRAVEQANFLEEAAEIANTTTHRVRRVLEELGKWEETAKRWGWNQWAYTDEELLDHLRTQAKILGKTPGQIYLNSIDGPSSNAYMNHFGSLTEAIRKAGLPLNHHRKGKLTPENKDDAVRRYQNGETIAKIAKTNGVTDNAILQVLKIRGVHRRDPNGRWRIRQHAKEIVRRYQRGETTSSIAARFGVSYTTIYRMLWYRGLFKRSKVA